MSSSESNAGSGPSTVAPFISAKREAFHNFVAKLRAPAIHSSASA